MPVPTVCDPAVPANADAATVQDFITAFTMVEAVELSNLDSGGNSIDCSRLNMALADAYRLLQSEKVTMLSSAAQVVDLNLRRWMLIIARYYLDTVRRRQDVTDDYNAVMKLLADLHDASKNQSSWGQYRLYNDNGKAAIWTEESLQRINSKTFGIL